MMRRWIEGTTALAVAVLCAGLPATGRAQDGGDDLLDDYDDAYFYDDDGGAPEVHDPFERANRGIFAFNEGLDRWVFEPVSKGWDFVMPDFAQTAVSKALANLRFPTVFLNDLLQGKPVRAAQDVARFAINTTIGLAGLMDPADAMGLAYRQEDFGQTLGYWGVPPGPYLMVPILGPMNVRDGAGFVVDLAPAFVVSYFYIPSTVSLSTGFGTRATGVVNDRAIYSEVIDGERAAALDFYVSVRSSYSQRREAMVRDEIAGGGGVYDAYSGGEDE